uniref:Ig-like domain-containing protein n=1 Tax=Astyanax mexicanus TaxID=7994 RepID=A0A8B9HTE5_ASTMX
MMLKFTTSLPEHMLTSSGIRPNDDGTYQLRKSVEIHEDDKAKYDCYVSHSSLPEPIRAVQDQDSNVTRAFNLAFPGENKYIYLIILKTYCVCCKYTDLFTKITLILCFYHTKEQWFKVNVEILMQRMNHSNTDLHVLQWRHGCEIDEFNNGTVKFLRGIDQDRYDGSDFLSFDNSHRVWVAPVQAAEETKRKWDGVAILNQYTQGYLEKECVDWLTKFMEYGKETLRKHSPPALYMSAKRSRIDPRKLTLTCLATGFYPKDVVMTIRKKFGTSLPEHLLTSSGIRPNDDGTYQLRKSAEINGDDPADYDCYVNHTTLEKPVITKWGNYNCGC